MNERMLSAQAAEFVNQSLNGILMDTDEIRAYCLQKMVRRD